MYGTGALTATSVGTLAVPGDRPAILSIDSGHLADGSDVTAGAGGELTVITGGADVGDPVAVKLPVTGGRVTQVVSARLRPNELGLEQNPSDLVAVVDAGGSTQVWLARSTRPGLPPLVAPLGGTQSPTDFPGAHLVVLPVPGSSPARDVVILVDDEGLRALRWNQTTKAMGLSTLVAGQFGWPTRNLEDAKHPGTLVALAVKASALTVTRLGLDAAGTGLVTSDVIDPFTGNPLVMKPPTGVDPVQLLASRPSPTMTAARGR